MNNMHKQNSVLWFVLLTVTLSFALYFIPLPAESRGILVAVLLTLIPTVVSLLLAFITEGTDGLRQLFSTSRGGVKWLAIGAMVGVLIRVAILVTGIILGMPIHADFSAPGTGFLLVGTIPLAYFEELGWRRFALDRLLKSRTPLDSALLIGVPWGLLHIVILLPGMISEGTPVLAQVGTIILTSIVLTWAYVRSGGSILTVTLLHGLQNGMAVLNLGIPMVDGAWLTISVYLVIAILFIFFERRLFFAKITEAE